MDILVNFSLLLQKGHFNGCLCVPVPLGPAGSGSGLVGPKGVSILNFDQCSQIVLPLKRCSRIVLESVSFSTESMTNFSCLITP